MTTETRVVIITVCLTLLAIIVIGIYLLLRSEIRDMAAREKTRLSEEDNTFT